MPTTWPFRAASGWLVDLLSMSVYNELAGQGRLVFSYVMLPCMKSVLDGRT